MSEANSRVWDPTGGPDGSGAWVKARGNADGSADVAVKSNDAEPIDRRTQYNQSSTGHSDNDVIWTSPDLRGTTIHKIAVSAGSVSIEATDDESETNWYGDLALRNLKSTGFTTGVANTPAAPGIVLLVGDFYKIRLLANGVGDIASQTTHSNGKSGF